MGLSSSVLVAWDADRGGAAERPLPAGSARQDKGETL